MTAGAVLAALAVAALAGLAAARLAAGYPRPPGAWRALGRREVAVVAAAAEALFPHGGAIARSGVEAGVPAYVDRFLAASQPRQRVLMHALLFLVEHATALRPAPGGLAGFRRFSKLSLAQRIAVLEGWEHSRIFLLRLAFTSLRAIFTFGYFAHPAVLRQLRLAPYAIDTPVCEADLVYPRIGAPRSSIALSRADLTPPSDGRPLALDGPLAPGYAEPPA